MNYWQRWIGDWKRKTAHLSAEAKGIYGELLDHIYATHATLPMDKEALYRIAGARSASECKTTDAVVREFFIEHDGGYTNKRAIEEISRRESYSAAQSERARLRWDRPAPERKPRECVNGAEVEIPAWLDAEQFRAWIKIRPARSRTPDAQTAVLKKLEKFRAAGHDANAIVQESLSNGWQGLFAPDAKRAGNKHGSLAGDFGRCKYCPRPATRKTNDIPHCEEPRHFDWAIARQ